MRWAHLHSEIVLRTQLIIILHSQRIRARYGQYWKWESLMHCLWINRP